MDEIFVLIFGMSSHLVTLNTYKTKASCEEARDAIMDDHCGGSGWVVCAGSPYVKCVRVKTKGVVKP